MRSKRDGSLEHLAGMITANNLDQVVFQVAGKDTRLDADLVVRITWGQTPASFRDARSFFKSGQFKDAAAQFRLCAGDASARAVVRASARLWAAQSLFAWGSGEPLHFAEAGDEARKFLSDFPTNREVPDARVLEARAKWMAGETAEAAELYKSIFEQWKPASPTPGYRRELCFEAGLNAARALCQLRPADTQGAREIYASLDKAVSAALADLEPNSPALLRLAKLQGEAALGEGFAALADGNPGEALTFFQGKLAAGPALSDATRCGAAFGLAQAFQALGKLREAQIEFARVSGLCRDDRDRAAAAQIGLADTTLELADPDAIPQARAWLEAVVRTGGDTLSARRAREMQRKL